jgi:hypothetical protein
MVMTSFIKKYALLEYSVENGWTTNIDGHVLGASTAEELCDLSYEALLQEYGQELSLCYKYTDESLQQASTEELQNPEIQAMIEDCPLCSPVVK